MSWSPALPTEPGFYVWVDRNMRGTDGGPSGGFVEIREEVHGWLGKEGVTRYSAFGSHRPFLADNNDVWWLKIDPPAEIELKIKP